MTLPSCNRKLSSSVRLLHGHCTYAVEKIRGYMFFSMQYFTCRLHQPVSRKRRGASMTVACSRTIGLSVLPGRRTCVASASSASDVSGFCQCRVTSVSRAPIAHRRPPANGVCVRTNVCQCESGFIGADCARATTSQTTVLSRVSRPLV